MSTIVQSEIYAHLVAFLEELFPLFDPSLPATTPTAEYGMDSLGITEIVLYLEEHFQIQVEDSELTRANLGTLQSIVTFVERKIGGKDV